MDTWQLVLLTILILLLANYAYRIFYDRIVERDIHAVEGFEDGMSSHGWHDDIYDKFYATVYNKIFQHDKLVQAEAAQSMGVTGLGQGSALTGGLLLVYGIWFVVKKYKTIIV